MKIVSLIPSGTEIISSLGFLEAIVGRSHGCDFPLEILDRPVLTKMYCVIERTSLSLDEKKS